MSGAARVMLARELHDLQRRPCSKWFSVHGLVGDNVFEWDIFVVGPAETLYAGGVYRAVLRFPPDYPMRPPSLQFLTPLLHPNVYLDGKVCISTLQMQAPDGARADSALFWRPILGVEQVVMSVVSLLSDANLDDPANAAAADLLTRDPATFREKCQENAAQSLKALPEGFQMPTEAPKESVNPQGSDRVEDAQHKARADDFGAADDDDDDDDEEAFVYSDDELPNSQDDGWPG